MQELWKVLKPGDEDWGVAESIDPARLPEHIAIIMDGNGRWARERRLPRVAGHRAGVDPVKMCAETCSNLGIKALTLYAFSVENWKRPAFEVDMLWRLLRLYLRSELDTMMRHEIQLQAVGRVDALPEAARDQLEAVIAATSRNRGMRLNLAINYGGRAEITDAVNRVIDEARLEGRLGQLRVDEAAIARNLYTAGLPDPDLLIRTSGEMRISNFLLWQIAYAELYVTNRYWPDFNRTELLRAILEYQRRDRRFGGLSAAPEPRFAEAGEELIEEIPVPVR